MSLLIQHGHGKSDKIERALDSGDAVGVIYSPRNESPENLVSYVGDLSSRYPDSIQIIDPQFYAAPIIGGNMGKLIDYPYFAADLRYRDFRSASDITRHVRNTLDFQRASRVTHLRSPTVCIDSFNDRWSAVAINLAAESINFHSATREPRPLLVSLLIHEQALRARDQLDEFLDEITDLECSGFYLVMRHESSNFTQAVDPASMEGLLYATYALRELNDFDVYVGYSDFIALPLHAAGATATACGWNNGSRRFGFGRFEPQSGGRRPKSRYSASPLLNSIPVTPEFEMIARLGESDRVISDTRYDAAFRTQQPSSVPWDETLSALHHWQVIHDEISDVSRGSDTDTRLRAVERKLRSADALYQSLMRAGAQFDGAAGPVHLADWANALAEFRNHAEI